MIAQITSNDLQQKITGYLEELANETDLARKSEEMQRYLDFVARFHHYSPSNIFLIMFSKPEATHVAGFQAWKKMGRYVRRGEKGIPIFSPLILKEDPDDDYSPKVLHGFRVVYVFDVSQTDGEPLPLVPDWKSPEKNLEINRKLMLLAEDRGIKLIFTDLQKDVQGVSKGGKIEIDFQAGTKTIVHELAHEILHRGETSVQTHSERESEAESVSYIVCRYFQFEELASPNYIVLNDGGKEMILKNMQRSIETAREIIDYIEGVK